MSTLEKVKKTPVKEKELKVVETFEALNKPLTDEMKFKDAYAGKTLINKDGSTAGNATGLSYQNTIFTIYPAPTHNCQIFSIGSFYEIFYYEDYFYSILKDAYDITCKRMLLIDLKETYIDKFRKLMKPEMIKFITPYVSTNGSDMNIILIDLSNLFPDEFNPDGSRVDDDEYFDED